MSQVVVEMESNGTRGGGNVVVAYCRMQDIGLRWIDADTLQVTLPLGIETRDRVEECFFYGRTIRVQYREDE